MKKDDKAFLVLCVFITLCIDIYFITLCLFSLGLNKTIYFSKIIVIPFIFLIAYFFIRNFAIGSSIKLEINYKYLICSFLSFAILLMQQFFYTTLKIKYLNLILSISLGTLFIIFMIIAFIKNFNINTYTVVRYLIVFLPCLFIIQFIFFCIATCSLYNFDDILADIIFGVH